MNEYISREEAIKELREVYEYEYPTASGDFDEYASHDVPNVLRNMPAADVQPVNQWISVKDRQPKCIHGSSDSVLVYRDNGECEVAYLVYDHDDGFYWYTQDERSAFEFEEVTHWMPLPDPPKDGDINE